jgi:hypothetical protein
VDSGSEEEDDDEIQGKTKLAQTLFSWLFLGAGRSFYGEFSVPKKKNKIPSSTQNMRNNATRYCICYFVLWHLIGWGYFLASLEKVVQHTSMKLKNGY